MVNGIEYRLTLEDCQSLQGFDNTFEICGTIQQRWKQIGNTIPTILQNSWGKI